MNMTKDINGCNVSFDKCYIDVCEASEYLGKYECECHYTHCIIKAYKINNKLVFEISNSMTYLSCIISCVSAHHNIESKGCLQNKLYVCDFDDEFGQFFLKQYFTL